jgi:peptide/nickel transport system permease protein
VAAIEAKYGLDDPILVQYGLWLRNAVQGGLRRVLRMHTPVSEEIVRRCWVTLELTLLAR